MRKLIQILTGFLMLAAVQLQLSGAELSAPPEINAESAILLDYETGTVLFEKNADKRIPPASMTKLMTIHTVLKFVNSGIVSINDIVPVSANADFRSLPPRSSLMFLEEGQTVSMLELLQGLALPSGNDAGIAVAEYLSGSVEEFVELMNNEAASLGMKSTFFADSSGLSEHNRTTAREYAQFCRYYIEQNIDFLPTLHGPADFTYPKPENLPPSGESVYGAITQPNHNMLIGHFKAADGLKTGYIDESGYNFAATAELDGRRLVLVTMGGPGETSRNGSLKRAFDAVSLLNYGFYGWSRLTPEVPLNGRIPVTGARNSTLKISYSRPERMLIRTAAIADLVLIEELDPFEFPLESGQRVGSWKIVNRFQPHLILIQGSITAAEDSEKAGVFKRLASVLYALIN